MARLGLALGLCFGDNHMDFTNRSSARAGVWLFILVLTILLAACGGDDHHHDQRDNNPPVDNGGDNNGDDNGSEPPDTTALINRDSALNLMAQTILSSNTLLMLFDPVTQLMYAPAIYCDDPATADAELGEDFRTEQVTYQDCQLNDDGYQRIQNGGLSMIYDGEGVDAPIHVLADNLTVETRESSDGEITVHTLTLDGAFTVSLLPEPVEFSFVDVNMRLAVDYHREVEGDPTPIDAQSLRWDFQDYDSRFALANDGNADNSIDGRITFHGELAGSADASTSIPIHFSDNTCPDLGALDLADDDDSSANLTFNGDELVLTTNGNGETLTCDTLAPYLQDIYRVLPYAF